MVEGVKAIVETVELRAVVVELTALACEIGVFVVTLDGL